MTRRSSALRRLAWMLAIWALSVGTFAAAVYGFRGLLPGKPHAAAGAAETGTAKVGPHVPADEDRRTPPAASAEVR